MNKENGVVDKVQSVSLTADDFSALVDESHHREVAEHDQQQRALVASRETFVKYLLDHHIEEGNWRTILQNAKAAAEAGQTELLLLRFPSQLCSDGGRAINAPQADWPETLRGEAAEIFHRWERDLKPNGFHLTARVLDFPGGIPGDIGLTMAWGH